MSPLAGQKCPLRWIYGSEMSPPVDLNVPSGGLEMSPPRGTEPTREHTKEPPLTGSRARAREGRPFSSIAGKQRPLLMPINGGNWQGSSATAPIDGIAE